MKRVIVLLLSVFLAINSASAVDFTLGGKGDLAYMAGYRTSGYDSYGNPCYDSFNGACVGVSVYCGIDFVKIGKKCRFGVRPEISIGGGVPGFVASVKLPLMFTFIPNRNVDWGLGLGVDVINFCTVGPSFDAFVGIKAGPGKIVINPSISYCYGSSSTYIPVNLGVGYQYTFK